MGRANNVTDSSYLKMLRHSVMILWDVFPKEQTKQQQGSNTFYGTFLVSPAD